MFQLIFCAVVLAAWWVLTIICNVRPLKSFIRQHDVLGIIPEWRFFAPSPIQADYCLVYREFFGDSYHGRWTEAMDQNFSRRAYHVFWNPNKRANKTIFDAMNHLVGNPSNSDGAVIGSIPYLLLLNYVTNLPRPEWAAATHVQFAIAQVFAGGQEEPSVLWISFRHPLFEPPVLDELTGNQE